MRVYILGASHGILLTLVLLLTVGPPMEHPADQCHEDQVYWWVADDVRACVALDDAR